MTFRRFLAWLVEKLFELHLAVAVVLIVKFFLPMSAESYAGRDAFALGVRDTYQGALDDAVFVTGSFMKGSYLTFAGQTYLAAVYVVVLYGYLASLYIFASLLACLFGQGHYVRNALIAYVFAAAIFWWRFVRAYDADMLRMAAVFMVLGVAAVAWSAWCGEGLNRRLGGKRAPVRTPAVKSGHRRVRLDLGT